MGNLKITIILYFVRFDFWFIFKFTIKIYQNLNIYGPVGPPGLFQAYISSLFQARGWEAYGPVDSTNLSRALASSLS